MNSTSDQPVWSEEADRELQAAVKLHGNDSRKIKTHLKNLVQVKAVDIKKRLLFLQQPVQQEQAKVEKPKPILKAIEKLAQKPFIKNVPPTPSLNAALKAGRVSKFSSSLSSQIEKSNVDISNRPKVSTIISAINTKNQFPTPAVIPALPPQFKHSKPFVNSPTIRRPEISNLSSSRATKRVFQGDDLPRSDAPLMKMPRDAKRRSTRFTGIRQNVFVKEDGVSRYFWVI